MLIRSACFTGTLVLAKYTCDLAMPTSLSAVIQVLPFEVQNTIVEFASEDITTGCSLALASRYFYDISRRIIVRSIAITSLVDLLSFHYAFIADRKSSLSCAVENLLIHLHFASGVGDDYRQLIHLSKDVSIITPKDRFLRPHVAGRPSAKKIRAAQHLRTISEWSRPFFVGECINQTMKHLSPGLKTLSLWIEFRIKVHIEVPSSCPHLRFLELTLAPGIIDAINIAQEAYPLLSHIHLRDPEDFPLSRFLSRVPSLQYLRLSGKINFRKLIASRPFSVENDPSEVAGGSLPGILPLDEVEKHANLKRIAFDIPRTYALSQPQIRSIFFPSYRTEDSFTQAQAPQDFDMTQLMMRMAVLRASRSFEEQNLPSNSVPRRLESMVKQGRIIFHFEPFSANPLPKNNAHEQWHYDYERGHLAWTQLEGLPWPILEGILADLLYRWREAEPHGGYPKWGCVIDMDCPF